MSLLKLPVAGIRLGTGIILPVFLVLLAACSESQERRRPAQPQPAPEVSDPVESALPVKPTAGPSNDEQTASKPQVPTFFGDVLPLFNAATPGRTYRCAVCHANYGNYDSVAKEGVVLAIISSLEDGSMPLNGDPVKVEEINSLKLWLAAGMPKGRVLPSTNP